MSLPRTRLLLRAFRPALIPAPRPLRFLPRFNSSTSTPQPNASAPNASTAAPSVPIVTSPGDAPPPPSYQLTFTCRPCQTRSAHTITKQAYHHGTVMIQCPECKNRHVITDHLKIFGDAKRSLEDILAEKGEVLKRARLTNDGDMEVLSDDIPEGAVPIGRLA